MPENRVQEVSEGTSLTLERFNKGTKQRRFKVCPCQDPELAKTLEGIPKADSPHPQDRTYLCDGLSAYYSGDGVCIVEAAYSNDRRAVFRTVNKDDARWYHWGWEQSTVMFDCPVNVWEATSLPSGTGQGQTVKVYAWRVKSIKIEETRIIRPLQVRLSDVVNVRWLDPIAEQRNKIHRMPDGRDYRFLGGQVNQVDDSTFDITYRWEQDKGSLLPFCDDDDVYIYRPTLDADLLRTPYSALQTVASTNPFDRAKPHKTILIYPYDDTDPQGWRTLPGANRIV